MHPAQRTILGAPDVETVRRFLRPAGRPVESLAELLETGFLARATAHPALARAMPLVAAAIETLGAASRLSLPDRAELTALRAWSLSRVAAMRSALLPLGDACARERIPAFLCKGAALHGLLYPEPSMRPASDVDVFLSAPSVVRLDRLLRGLGYVPEGDSAARVEAFVRTGERHPELVDLGYLSPSRDLIVEVKADPVGVGVPPRRLAALAEGGTPSPCYPGFLLPRAETMVLQQAFSLARRPTPDLLAHAELAGVLWTRREELDVDRLLDLVRGEGLYGILRSVLVGVERAFPSVVPPALLRHHGRPAGFTPRRLRRGTLASQPTEDRWMWLSLWGARGIGGRPLATARWMLGRVFPPQPILGAQTGGRRGPLAWGTRLARLALR